MSIEGICSSYTQRSGGGNTKLQQRDTRPEDPGRNAGKGTTDASNDKADGGIGSGVNSALHDASTNV
jgi:hypothetical protein